VALPNHDTEHCLPPPNFTVAPPKHGTEWRLSPP